MTAWPGSSIAGKDAPEIVNPVPATAIEFTVSAALPDEVIVRLLVAVVFSVTLPKLMLLEFKVSWPPPADVTTSPPHPQTVHSRKAAPKARKLGRRLSSMSREQSNSARATALSRAGSEFI